jgi:hypothetical protein
METIPEVTESTRLETEAIETGDMHYVARLFYNRLLQHPEQNGRDKYYYQYNSDSDQTLYEKLMGSHQICISARSCHEAKVVSAILQVLIDGHTFSLEKYLSLYQRLHSTNPHPAPLTVTNLFVLISNSDFLSEHSGHSSDVLKAVNPITHYEQTSSGSYEITPAEFEFVRVFDVDTVLEVLESMLVGNRSFDLNDRKQFVLNVLGCAPRSC